ncbi:MAG: hypothetical protein GXO49_00875 [Chlorobi bacterium]|nr:hypothetical protein [Chlorobiota bacterium]
MAEKTSFEYYYLILIALFIYFIANYRDVFFSKIFWKHFFAKFSKEFLMELGLTAAYFVVKYLFLKEKFNKEHLMIEILVALLILTFLFLLKYMRDLKSINYPNIKQTIENIRSNKLKSIAKYYIPEAVEKIEQSLTDLLNNNVTTSILWELKFLNLQALESDNSFKNLTSKQQKKMIEHIYEERRRRITKIANELITKNGKYFTTETNKPSNLETYDNSFWNEQKRIINEKKPIEARRFLIIKKDELIEEYINHQSALIKYVEFNNHLYTRNLKKKSVIFHIIVYNEKIEDVFCGSGINNNLFDFTISTYKGKTTVFAQSSDTIDRKKFSNLSAFDSEKNSSKLQSYIDWYNNMINNKENTLITKNFNCQNDHSGYIKSKEIKDINDIKNFIDIINNLNH